jgi:UDP-N-acetylmuramoylalanine--D-glutamate ligase
MEGGMINNLLSKTVAILGLGKSGMAILRELKKRGVHVIAWDDKEDLRKEASSFGAKIQDLTTLDFSNVEFLVISPAIPHTYPTPNPVVLKAKEAGIKIIDDVEVFVSTYNKSHYIGITGTNGKSTTTALIYHILKENNVKCAIGGNFGIPVFDLPDLGEDGWYVLEMSSYQIELSPSIDFDISVLLNITPDHLDRHNGMDGYVNVKKQIFNRASKKTISNIIAVDDEYTKRIYNEISKNSSRYTHNIPVSFDRKTDGYYVNSKGMLIDNTKNEKKELLDLSTLENLKGKHNWQNIVVSFATCKQVGISTTKIINAIKTFSSLEHRVEKVAEFAGVEFINDSKATNAEATQYAIASLDDVYWIVGGRKKDGGIDILLPQLSKGNIKRIFTIGECEKEFFNKTKKILPSYKMHKLEKAIVKAFKLAIKDLKKGKVKKPTIILSPACASFDQYKSFEKRGEHFKKLVGNIILKYKNKLG